MMLRISADTVDSDSLLSGSAVRNTGGCACAGGMDSKVCAADSGEKRCVTTFRVSALGGYAGLRQCTELPGFPLQRGPFVVPAGQTGGTAHLARQLDTHP
jgi:hypothetical protein